MSSTSIEAVTSDPDGCAHSPLYNADLAPTTPAQRKWTVWSMAALWISMSACIPTYTLASGLVKSGMNWWESVLTIFAGSAVVLLPMVLNGFAGTKYGIPFPVYCRAAFGTRGANLPAMLRAFVACGWFGIQTWIGGAAIFAIAALYHPAWADPALPEKFGITLPQFTCFMAFWALNMAVIFAGIESIRILLDIKAPLLIVLGLLLLGWAGVRVHQLGHPLWQTLNQPSQFVPGGAQAGMFWKVFFPSVTAAVGFWATLSLNIPDFTRYAKSQRDQVLGQALGLPTTMALYSFIAVAVTSATVVIFGKTIDDPVALLTTFHSKNTVVIAMGSVVLATLATNIAANVVSPANDFSNLAPRFIGFRLGGLLTGLVGIAIMPWKLLSDPHHYIFTWLIGSSSLLGAVGGVLICDYWIVRRARLNVKDLFQPRGTYTYDRGINWCGILAVALALMPCVPGFVDRVTDASVLREDTVTGTVFRDLFDYSWFVTFGVAFVTYFILMIGHSSVTRSTTLASPALDEPLIPEIEAVQSSS
jgi:NCS1 family nucleobase:cation symporter-1